MALAADPLRQPVSELPAAPDALVPDCAFALVPDCPAVPVLELPMPAPLEEVPVEFGVVAVPLGFEEPYEPWEPLLFCVPVEFCVLTEPACGLVVVVVVLVVVLV